MFDTVLPRILHSVAISLQLQSSVQLRYIEYLTLFYNITAALWNLHGTCAAEHHTNIFIQIEVLYSQSAALQSLYFSSVQTFQAYPKALNIKRLLLLNIKYAASCFIFLILFVFVICHDRYLHFYLPQRCLS